MKLRFLLMTCAAMALSVSAVAQERKTDSLDAKQLVGQWTFVSGTKAGTESAQEALASTVTIDEKSFTLPAGPDMTFVMGYTIDASTDPAQIDMEIKEGPVPEGKAVGIIKFANGQLTLCYNATGGDRPTAFASDEDNGNFLFVLKKASATFDAKMLIGNWNYVSGKRAGADVNEQSLSLPVSVSKDAFTVPAGPDESFLMAYEVDAEKSPVHIDFEIKAGPVEEGKAVGIIKMDGDQMTLCYDPTGETRPEKFESTEDNGFFLFVFKRDKD